MKTNPNGVRYDIQRQGDRFTLYILDVHTPLPITGFMTYKCAERYAVKLQPVVDNHLIRCES